AHSILRRPRRQVVRQGSAKPSSRVRFPPWPPVRPFAPTRDGHREHSQLEGERQMPFTSPAALRADLESADAGPVRGYAVVFASEEAGWVVDWYDDATGIQLPPVKEWLSGARQDHRWFSAFVPARGEHMPAVE